jgi:thiamine-phosphate pyrophosphorylase
VTPIAEAPRCRLYLTTPPGLVSGGLRLRDFLDAFGPATEAVDVACLLIDAPADAGDEAIAQIARPLNEMAQARGIATLLTRAALAKRIGSDGAHLDLRAMDAGAATRAYREARKALGGEAIIGTLCAAGRHMAMELAELDADYVGFDLAAPDAAESIAWWGEVMNVPCIAFGAVDPAAAASLAQSGADFIAPPAELWAGDAPARLAELQAAIRTP